jgi:ABC-type multidrug transport system fused ATPase/permease subunit
VEFDNVSFSYDDRKSTLKNIDVTAEYGQTVAFVGETSSGKSTILRLLLRLYDVTEGVIKIDGQDLRGIKLSSLRDAIGVAPQDSLFIQLNDQGKFYFRSFLVVSGWEGEIPIDEGKARPNN